MINQYIGIVGSDDDNKPIIDYGWPIFFGGMAVGYAMVLIAMFIFLK